MLYDGDVRDLQFIHFVEKHCGNVFGCVDLCVLQLDLIRAVVGLVLCQVFAWLIEYVGVGG